MSKRDYRELIRQVGLVMIDVPNVGVGVRVNYAMTLLAEVIRHLSDYDSGKLKQNSFSDFHTWGDLATAASDLNMATILDDVPKENVREITKKLQSIAKEFEVSDLPCEIDPELQSLVDFMDPSWKPTPLGAWKSKNAPSTPNP